MTPVRRSRTTEAMPPAGVVISGVPDAIASRTMFGRPSTLPLSSRTEGIGNNVGRREPARDLVLRQVAEESDPVADARGARPAGASSASRSPAPAIAACTFESSRRHRGKRIDQVLEALLAHEPAGREEEWRMGRDAERRAAPRAERRDQGGSDPGRRRMARRRLGPARRRGRSPARRKSALHAVTAPRA